MQLPKGVNREEFKAGIAAFELWFTKATRIARVMARGAYWVSEKKKLMTVLGSKTYELIREGKISLPEFDNLVAQIQRIAEKLEKEEQLVQEIRSGRETSTDDTIK